VGLDFNSLVLLAQGAGFTDSDAQVAAAIALAESGGNPAAVGDQNLAPSNGPSIGLWQINIGARANPQYASQNLYDPQSNAAAAYAIYQAQGFGAWSTFTSGRYQAFLQAPAPLTIDASTGQVVTDVTPTPAMTVGQISTGQILLLTAAGAALYFLANALADF